MSDEITFRSDIGISKIQVVGSDAMVVAAARVSTTGLASENGRTKTLLTERDRGLIRFLAENRHTSPFEHGTVTVAVEAPIFVAREWMRHRTQSYNEESGRYRKLKPVFYCLAQNRPTRQVGKPGAYSFERDDMLSLHAGSDQMEIAKLAWEAYSQQLARGVAKEVARMVLPLSIYTSFYATANLLNWLRFLSLRNDAQAMFEIREGAIAIERIIRSHWPETWKAWNEAGRRM